MERELNKQAKLDVVTGTTPNSPKLEPFSDEYAKDVYARRTRVRTAREVSRTMGAKVLPEVDDLGVCIASLEHIALACQILSKEYTLSGVAMKELIAIRIKHSFAELNLRFTTSETSLAASAFRAIASELENLGDDCRVEYWLSKAKARNS